MKKIISLLPCLCIAIIGFSQQSVAINNDGSVPNASAMLDVKSTTKGLLIPRMTSGERTGITGVKGLMVFDNTTSSFWFHNGTTWTELNGGGGSGLWTANGTHIYNTNTGNIGIGINTPSFDLHIRRPNPSIGFYDEDDAHASGTIEGDSTNLVLNAYRKPIGLFYRAGDIIMQVNGGAGSFTTTPGNVGIGTTSPMGKLHVGTGNVMIGAGSPETKLHVRGGTGELFRLDGSAPQINFVSDDVNLAFINITGTDLKMGTLAANNTGKFIVRTNGGDRLQVDESGNVTIGTETPAVGYRLSINGKAICTELKVQLQSNWPDYVFTPGHKRLSIAELDKYLQKNKHLPGIPTAQQVKSDGIAVGDMQRMTMEKVEELALYIVELKKEIDLLKKSR